MANALGFRLDFDRSEIGEDEVGKLVSAVQQAVDPYGTVTLANNATYSVGTSVDMLVLDIGNGGTVTEDESIRVLLDSTATTTRWRSCGPCLTSPFSTRSTPSTSPTKAHTPTATARLRLS